MKLPLSWIRDYVDLKISPEELAERLTFAGLEVEQMEYIGVPRPAGSAASGDKPELAWDRKTLVVGKILAITQHPNADRLTLATVDVGAAEPIQVVTGAPNIHVGEAGHRVAFALEGARLYDGHAEGWKLMTLKKSKIRGIESGSMVCSEKELAISEEHDGIILLPSDAPIGMPLADYLGDIIFDIKINPNMARCASVIGIAREVAALTGQPLRPVPQTITASGAPIRDQLNMLIQNPELNPRFTAALLRDTTIQPSPFWVQRRLSMAGMRPINNIVDVTNYVMLETGQPLHAFDYDKLVARAGGKSPTIITRLAQTGEELETLDGVKRKLDSFTILVCDTHGALSIGGVMGGAASEVSATTKNVLLEAAAWEYINIRKTMAAQHLASEAGYRFSRGVHPAQAETGLRRAIELMRELGGGVIAQGIADEYPAKPVPIVIHLPIAEVKRLLGVEIPTEQIVKYLTSLEFQVDGGQSPLSVLRITVPEHRLDVDGTDDLIEEIARLYGYDRLPNSRMNDELPPQRANVDLEQEEVVRDVLIEAGLQEVITYRMTTPAREEAFAFAARDYARIENPISADRAALRQTLTANLIELALANLRYRPRVALFEIGPVFWWRGADEPWLPREMADALPEDRERPLPLERRRLGIVIAGPRAEPGWQTSDATPMDFYDLKGILEALLAGLHLSDAAFTPAHHAAFHPGRAATLKLGDAVIGVFGELHPAVREKFDLPPQAILSGEFDLDALLTRATTAFRVTSLSRFPAVTQDLALVMDDNVPAERVQTLMAQTGGTLLQSVVLFDVYRGDQIPAGKKSLAYTLTFQALDRTLTDDDAAKLRGKIAQRLQRELGAQVRGA